MNDRYDFYNTYRERTTIADALKTIVLHENVSANTIDKLISIVENEATALKRHDVIENLYFAGLIYG